LDRARARVEALKASIEMRAGVDAPEQIVARAKIFESYIDADGLAETGPAAPIQAKQETASGASRRK
jgi:hypothetical protein